MNHAKLNEINAKIERGEMSDGHWFCSCCQKITEIVTDGPQPAGTCAICGSMRVKYHPNEPDRVGNQELERRLVNRAGQTRREPTLSREDAHRWFELARAAAEQAQP